MDKIDIDVMVVGIKALNDDLIELELQPLAMVQEKKDILGLAMNGDTKGLMNAMQQNQRLNHKILVTREWCMAKHILPFCSTTLQFDTSENHKKRTGTK